MYTFHYSRNYEVLRAFGLIMRRTLSICAAVSGLVVSVTAFERSVITLVIGASNCKVCNFCKLDRLRPMTRTLFFFNVNRINYLITKFKNNDINNNFKIALKIIILTILEL